MIQQLPVVLEVLRLVVGELFLLQGELATICAGPEELLQLHQAVPGSVAELHLAPSVQQTVLVVFLHVLLQLRRSQSHLTEVTLDQVDGLDGPQVDC